jgi:TolR protein
MALIVSPSGDSSEDRYEPLSQINVTPMVDVMLVLLVIFMVAAPLLTVGVRVSLPKTSAAQVMKPQQPIVVSINKDGELFLGEERLAPADLKSRLAALAQADPDRVVYVRGDRSIRYDQLMDLLGAVSAAGFAKVSLLAEAVASPK